MVIPKISLLFSVVVFLFLSACTGRADFQGYSPEEYRAKHPMENKVVTSHALIDLEFNGTSKTLSAKDSDYFHDILSKINPHAVDNIMLQVASVIPHKKERAKHIHGVLRKAGYKLPLNVVTQEKLVGNKMIVIITYAAVIPPDCPDWKKSPIVTYSNTPHTNYACAATVNLGLMIDNPRDLIRGQDSRISNTERSDKALSDYRSGVEPSSTATASSTGN